MRVPRPPRSAGIRLIIYFLVVSIPTVVGGQELVVPDFVLPGRVRDIIEFPDNYPDPSSTWSVAGPGFRRIYPLADLATPRPPVNLPRFPKLADLPPLASAVGNIGNMPILIKANYSDVPGRDYGNLAAWRRE
ncbi:MAG: hypothetical protein P1P77_07350 [Spirochaetaceae bacterium]|nr:hypothetical protein [Spirochaetaceae bacterium]